MARWKITIVAKDYEQREEIHRLISRWDDRISIEPIPDPDPVKDSLKEIMR